VTIRQIHPHGPAVGEYIRGEETDLHATFTRIHWTQYYDQAIAQGLTGEEATRLANSMTEAK
jgi:hypothetical protein